MPHHGKCQEKAEWGTVVLVGAAGQDLSAVDQPLRQAYFVHHSHDCLLDP
jgi:hypothetical protein